MQTIFYPGHLNQPCQAQYGIAIRSDENGPFADIVGRAAEADRKAT